jgi:hypothetical protein
VQMEEVSPLTKSAENPFESQGQGQRPVSTGVMRRVFKSRMQARGAPRPLVVRSQEGDLASGSESEDENGDVIAPLTHNTSHHYTLNIPTPPVPQSDTPYILLGCVAVILESMERA